MQFFTSPEDLMGWVKIQESPSVASQKIMEITGRGEEQDIVDTCNSIFEKPDSKHAAEVLYSVLAKHNLVQIREGKMKDKLVKEAQAVMRSDSLYGNLDMRVCPKLPKQSAGQGLISTFNCRTYCLDSMVFDEEPNKVYCAEAMWRRHVMDKFSREFKDKDGKWVGGYLNERFQMFRDDGGNNMELANGERTRKPRPHQYSTERRLEEARGEKTIDLVASSGQFVKLASVNNEENDKVYKIFDDIMEMRQAGVNEEDIIYKVAEHYNASILEVASINKMTKKIAQRHDGIIYACDHKTIRTSQTVQTNQSGIELLNSLPIELQNKAKKIWPNNIDSILNQYAGNRDKLIQDINSTTVTANNSKTIKTAISNLPEKSSLVTKKDMQVKIDGKETILKMETPVVIIKNGNDPVFHITDGPSSGTNFTLKNTNDTVDGFAIVDEGQDMIQEAADELGLNDSQNHPMTAENDKKREEFPVVNI